MANVSVGISNKTHAKSRLAVGTLAPNTGNVVEIRLDDSAWKSTRELENAIRKLIDVLRERGNLGDINK